MFVNYCHSVNDILQILHSFFTLLRYSVSLVVKGFESGQSSNDLSRVPACMAHVKTGEDDVLKKVRLCFLKSGGCQAPLYSLAGWGQGAAWKG